MNWHESLDQSVGHGGESLCICLKLQDRLAQNALEATREIPANEHRLNRGWAKTVDNAKHGLEIGM